MSDKLSPDMQKQVERGVDLLLKGGVVAFPTDTVYGLGACSYLPRAVERVYDLKRRSPEAALPLLLSGIEQISSIAASIPPVAWVLAEKFMPGALTLVLYKSSSVSSVVTAGGETVAVRVPNHPVPVALALGVKGPISGTSANLSGRISALTPEEVRDQFGNKIDFIIDGGRCSGGRESTIVDVTGNLPTVLREGAISVDELKTVCDNIMPVKGV